jgi:hypothetical protein
MAKFFLIQEGVAELLGNTGAIEYNDPPGAGMQEPLVGYGWLSNLQ